MSSMCSIVWLGWRHYDVHSNFRLMLPVYDGRHAKRITKWSVSIANWIHTFANYYFSNYNYTKTLANHWVFTCIQLKTSLAIFTFCLGPVNRVHGTCKVLVLGRRVLQWVQEQTCAGGWWSADRDSHTPLLLLSSSAGKNEISTIKHLGTRPICGYRLLLNRLINLLGSPSLYWLSVAPAVCLYQSENAWMRSRKPLY